MAIQRHNTTILTPQTPPAEVLTPELLLLAYGSQMHIVHGAGGDLLLADSCCGGEPNHDSVHESVAEFGRPTQ